MSAFENVVPPLARALTERGYAALTPVQSAVLDPDLQSADLVVSAQTGSGKTVAFGLTIASNLLEGAERLPPAETPLALIIAPTRELAIQVRGELEWLFGATGAQITSCVGGMDMRDERRALARGAHIVVGTPGRLVDHIRRGSLQMNALRAVVLDEADEMLNLGFREELEFILEAAPAERRTLMFSATMPRPIEHLAKRYQRDAVRVNTVGKQKQHADIEYRALTTAGHDVENAIFNVLRYYDATNAIVFCGTRAAVTRLSARFANRGLSVVTLSGELSQKDRTKALQAMRDHRARVCIATDVAARGIDLPDLDLVVHADLPTNTEALLHRSGRTGRAGRKGASVLVVPYSARRRIERLLHQASINAQWGEPPSADDIKRRDDQRLLSDELLRAQPDAGEQHIVRALLEQHDPVQIAAAFVRLYRKDQAAPEDLQPAQQSAENWEQFARDAHPAARGTFEGGAWISLSAGRNKNAEPRWLIPLLCKAGGITKRQLGSIQIQQDVSYVEIDAGSIDAFMAQIGEDGRLEKSIRVTRLDHAPDFQRATRPSKRTQYEGRDERPRHAPKPAHAERPKQRPHKPAQRDAPPPAKANRKPDRAKRPHAPANKKSKWHPAE